MSDHTDPFADDLARWEEGDYLSAALGDESLVGVFARIAAQRPDKIAVIDPNGESLRYGELAHRVRRWAARLAEMGVVAGTPVALCAQGEFAVPLGFLAILAAGGVVVPLDPSLPDERLRVIADGVGCQLVLVGDKAPPGLPPQLTRLDLTGTPDASPALALASAPEHDAVIYHTSGTTGRPKPVVLTHRALSTRLLSMSQWFGITADDVVAGSSSLAFDPFLQQLFFPLCSGGTLWLVDRVTLLDPARFWLAVLENGVTHINLVPTQTDALLLRPPAKALPALRRVVVGGERMPADLPARLVAALGEVAVFNMYGPTEATVDATGCRADTARGDRAIPIGRPLPGCRIRILDAQMRRVAPGVAGEIHIGGVGLARGYLGQSAATGAAFVADPYAPAGERLYRSGDFGCWRDDGQIEFIGRRDEQIKVRGQRIELGEIEAALRAFPGVSAASAGLWNAAPGGAAVVAHFTGSADPAALRAWLTTRLPPPAVPAHLMAMAELPTLPSGKVDRSALPIHAMPAMPEVAAFAQAEPTQRVASTLERSIAAVWADLLGCPSVDTTANLFEIGAHSLHVPRALIAIEQATGHPLSAVDLFRYPSVAALARHLAGAPAQRPGSPHRARRQNSRLSRRHADGSEAIAIVGMALRFPGASDRASYWAALQSATDCIHRPTRETLRQAGAPAALIDQVDFVAAHGAIDDSDRFDAAAFGYSPGEAAEIDPQQRLLLELAWHALDDAACDPARDGPIGAFAGVGFNSYLLDNLRERIGAAGGADRFSAVVGSDKDFAATRIAYKLGLTGPALTVNCACSTALAVTATAVDNLRAGRCRVALAASASLGMFSPYGHLHTAGGIASASGVCRPFDANADGVVAGAGAAVLVLKRLDDALADGDRIDAVIHGVGMANDGAAKAAFSAPSVDGQVAALAAALDDAQVTPAQIGFVEGHGTATRLGDPIELTALNQVYRGAERDSTLLGSVKGHVGHLDAAAGMAGLIKTVLALQHGQVPPTANYTAPNPELPLADGPFRLSGALEPWPGPADRPRLAGVSAFGMGGTNVHLIVGEAPRLPAAPALPMGGAERIAPTDPVLLTFSAAGDESRASLAAALASTLDALDAGGGRDDAALADIASSLARRRALRARCAAVATSPDDAATALRAKAMVSGSATNTTFSAAFLFPGQGAQKAGMARALYRTCPAFSAVIDRAERQLRGGPLHDLRALLLAADDDARATATLSATQYTQPALFVVEYALAQALASFGLFPTALLGHSIGEYVAACLAGVMDFDDALRLVVTRGRLMSTAPAGAMLAVALPEATLQPLLKRCGADLAAVNGARQCVASGNAHSIAELERALAATATPTYRLPVSNAFHSALMEPILDAYAAELAHVDLRAPTLPMISNVSGDWLGADEAQSAAYWVRHLRSTVRFADGLKRLLDDDPTRHLIEAGPGAALTRLARGAGVSAGRAVATQSPEIVDGQAALLDALGRLWVDGAPIDRLAAAGNSPRRVTLPAYPFARTRLWIEPDATAKVAKAALAALAANAAHAEMNRAVPKSSAVSATPTVDELQGAIAEVWSQVLGVPTIAADDDFLELGGDSLIAVRIAGRLGERLGRTVTASALFKAGNVAALARLLDDEAPEPAATETVATNREEGWL